jgi:hypothetical protein
MKRIQPYFKFHKKKQILEVWSEPNQNLRVYPLIYILTEEEIPIVEKLIQRDFKTAILYRKSENKGIEILANDIIEQRG